MLRRQEYGKRGNNRKELCEPGSAHLSYDSQSVRQGEKSSKRKVYYQVKRLRSAGYAELDS